MPFESDWVFLRAALPELQDYILSGDIYWPMRPPARSTSGLQMPQLSIGNLVLAQARLRAVVSGPEQEQELSELTQGIQAVREKWRTNWGNKAVREFGMRLNLWQQYLRELRGEPRVQAAYYANEVRQRAVLSLLADELNDGVPPGEQEQLSMLDQITRGLTRTGPFVWEPALEPSFPPETFWFLYVTLQK